MIDSTFMPSNIQYISNKGLSDVKCFPNPANEKVIFSFVLEEPDYIQLKVYNLTGVEVVVSKSRWFPSGKSYIENIISDLPHGMYFYRIQNSTGLFIHN